MKKNLVAFTEPTGAGYPQYISINQLEDGCVEITVRSPAKSDGSCGDGACATLTTDQFYDFCDDLRIALL